MLPSEVKMKSYRGCHRDVFTGWQKMPEATIIGEGYIVEFSRLFERTIDPMCDALNGWYALWTKFCCEYTDSKGKLSIIFRKPEDADKLYSMLADVTPLEFEYEDTLSAADVARSKIETLISLITQKKH